MGRAELLLVCGMGSDPPSFGSQSDFPLEDMAGERESLYRCTSRQMNHLSHSRSQTFYRAFGIRPPCAPQGKPINFSDTV